MTPPLLVYLNEVGLGVFVYDLPRAIECEGEVELGVLWPHGRAFAYTLTFRDNTTRKVFLPASPVGVNAGKPPTLEC